MGHIINVKIESKCITGNDGIETFALIESFNCYLKQCGLIISSNHFMYKDLLHSFNEGTSFSINNINEDFNKYFGKMLTNDYYEIENSNHFDWLRDFFLLGYETYNDFKKKREIKYVTSKI